MTVPLPERYFAHTIGDGLRTIDGFTADQLRAYGDACREDEHARMNAILAKQNTAHHAEVQAQVAAERERCILKVYGLCDSDNAAQRIATAIRNMEQPK